MDYHKKALWYFLVTTHSIIGNEWIENCGDTFFGWIIEEEEETGEFIPMRLFSTENQATIKILDIMMATGRNNVSA
ncbi:MAG: hypothetical protein KAS78_05460 [Candidatus Pacebacteria bacterium]|nr:hypothetical protein [Candidatus Paceibacterota bacterium]